MSDTTQPDDHTTASDGGAFPHNEPSAVTEQDPDGDHGLAATHGDADPQPANDPSTGVSAEQSSSDAKTSPGASDGESVNSTTPLPSAAGHRKAPRYSRFIMLGIFFAALVAFIAVWVTTRQSEYRASDLFWLLMLWLGPLGILLGASTAFILDRRSLKKLDQQLDSAE